MTKLQVNCAIAGEWGKAYLLPKHSDSDLSDPVTKG